MYAQPRPCRGGRATSRERGGIGIAAGGKGEPPPPPPYTISDDDRGSPQTPGAGSAVGLGRRSVGLEPHESPTTPPHRRDGRTRCRPMQAAASTAPAILAAARRHAPARKRGYRRRSRAACVVIRAAPGPLFDVTAAPGAGRCAPDPRPLSHPPDPPARRTRPLCAGLARRLPAEAALVQEYDAHPNVLVQVDHLWPRHLQRLLAAARALETCVYPDVTLNCAHTEKCRALVAVDQSLL